MNAFILGIVTIGAIMVAIPIIVVAVMLVWATWELVVALFKIILSPATRAKADDCSSEMEADDDDDAAG